MKSTTFSCIGIGCRLTRPAPISLQESCTSEKKPRKQKAIESTKSLFEKRKRHPCNLVVIAASLGGRFSGAYLRQLRPARCGAVIQERIVAGARQNCDLRVWNQLRQVLRIFRCWCNRIFAPNHQLDLDSNSLERSRIERNRNS